MAAPPLPRHRVGLLASPGVTLPDVAGPAEVFTEANRFGARYEVSIHSLDGSPVRSSTGVGLVADGRVAAVPRLDTALLPGSDACADASLDPDLVAAAAHLA